jgi:hypothetical protein
MIRGVKKKLKKYFPIKKLKSYQTNMSERSVCAVPAALQTGCVANVVATEFIVFFLSLYALLLFSQKGLS